MSSARRHTRFTTLTRLTMAAAIRLLVVSTTIIVCWTLYANGGVEASGRSKAQGEKPAPVQPENEADTPLEITEASVEIGEPYESTLRGLKSDGQEVALIDKGEKARRIKLTLKMVNKSDYKVVQFIARLLNPGFLSNESILVDSHSAFSQPVPHIEINPQETFTFTTDLPLAARKDGQELANHLSGFRVKIAEAVVNQGVYQEWVEGGNFGKLFGRAEDTVTVIDCAGGKVFRLVKKRPADEPPTVQPSDNLAPRGVLISTESCGTQIMYPRMGTLETGRSSPEGSQATSGKDSETPIILYSERASYSEEARVYKIEGTVALSVVFNVSGGITDIRTIAGLPYALTENAIAAARKIRFQPAVKNGAPVSVRGLLTFSFTLY
jgi:TonB family protein